MAITVQAGAGASYGSGGASHSGNDLTTVSPPLPADVASGDLLLLFIELGNLVTVSSGVTGWTQVAFHNNFGADNFYLYKKTAGGSETAPSVVVSGSTFHTSVLVRVRGWEGTTGPAQLAANIGSGPTDSIDPPTAGSIKIAFLHLDPGAAGTTTWGSGATALADVSANSTAFLSVAYKAEDTSGSISWTWTGSTASNMVWGIFSIAPAAVTTPVAAFSGTPLTGTAPLNVTFTDASTNTPTSWLWTFGDGATSTSQNPSHSYAAAGTYTVQLDATNAAGTDNETKTGYVTVSSGFVPQIVIVT